MKGLVVSFRGQYNHLIKRSLWRIGIEVLIVDHNVVGRTLRTFKPDLIVLGGGPYTLPKDYKLLEKVVSMVLDVDVPTLGICLAHQLIALYLGGIIGKSRTPEYGMVNINIVNDDPLFNNIPKTFRAWCSHNDEVKKLPKTLKVIAKSDTCPIEGFKLKNKPIYGLQFHPEVEHTEYGLQIFENLKMIARS